MSEFTLWNINSPCDTEIHNICIRETDPTSPFWRRSALGFLWKEWCLSWNSSTLATSCEELTHWKRLWCWDWGQEEKGTTEDEMAGWHHWLDGRESEWTPGVGDGQGGVECCDSWGRKESNTTERTELNWTESIHECVVLKTEVSPQKMMDNLKSQVRAPGYHSPAECTWKKFTLFEAYFLT